MRVSETARTVRCAVVVLVAGLAAGDARGGEPAATTAWPAEPMPVLGSQFSPPLPLAPQDPVPAPAARAELIDGDPAWQVDLPGDLDPIGVATTRAGYVVRTRDDRLIGLDRDGQRLWEYEQDRFDPVKVDPDVVLVSREHPTDDRWPRPRVVVALDPATGREVWEEREASFWSAFTDVVYMSVCYGGQDGELGDCQLSARDPLTNRLRWRMPTYASAQVMGARGLHARPAPPYLVVESFPTGLTSRTVTTIDPGTGWRLAVGFDGPLGYAAFPQTLISVDGNDDNPANGCTATLTGYDLASGRQAWRYVATTIKEGDGVYCADLPDPDPTSGRLAVTNHDGRPEVLDAATGQVEWTAPRPGRGLAASEDLLLAFEPAQAGDADARELVLYELSGGGQRWRAPAPGTRATPEEAVILDRMVLTHWDGYEGPIGYDLRDGDWWAYYSTRAGSDASVSFGPGTVAVCRAGGCSGWRLQ